MRLKIFYGWLVVFSMFMTLLVHAGAGFYVFGIFYKPLAEEFGWDLASISLAMTVYMLTMGLTAPIMGRMTDRFGEKTVILTGALIAGTGLLLLSRTTSLGEFYFLYFVVGLGFSGCGIIPASSAITNWFAKKRGIAIGLAMAGVSVGAFTITLAAGYIMAGNGWRFAYCFLGILSLVLVIPLVLLVMKNTPQEIGLLPDGGPSAYGEGTGRVTPKTSCIADLEGWTAGMAIRNQSFWLIALGFFLIFFSIGAVLQHEVNYLTDMGISRLVAASALAFTGGFGGLGKISFGYLADRVSPKNVAILSFAMQAAGIIILIFATSMTSFWAFAFIFGFAMGGQIALQPLIIADLFGLASFGTIYGIVTLAAASGTALGPVLAGLVYDLSGSYFWVFWSCAATSLGATILVFLARRPTLDKEMAR